ncbi:MAG: hypothetical protein AUJ52_14300 [Elusimicrobia bacterium CG1_02_63_36]|nr:MAG: hypothetical protein AUJ52_14300 [Elusimicrobia bacterium CG1_02_63_36]
MAHAGNSFNVSPKSVCEDSSLVTKQKCVKPSDNLMFIHVGYFNGGSDTAKVLAGICHHKVAPFKVRNPLNLFRVDSGKFDEFALQCGAAFRVNVPAADVSDFTGRIEIGARIVRRPKEVECLTERCHLPIHGNFSERSFLEPLIETNYRC